MNDLSSVIWGKIAVTKILSSKKFCELNPVIGLARKKNISVYLIYFTGIMAGRSLRLGLRHI